MPFQTLRRVTHPDRQRRRNVYASVPGPALERVEFSVAIADQLLGFFGQFAGMRLAAIENGDLVPATERVLHLEGTRKPGTAQDENTQRLYRPAGGEQIRCARN